MSETGKELILLHKFKTEHMKMHNCRCSCFLGLIFVYSFLFAFNGSSFSQSWIKNIGGSLDDKAYAVVVDKAGNIYITGYTTQSGGNIDIITFKLNQNGEQQWSKTFDGAGHSDDKAYAITLDKSNNIIVTGYTTGISSHHDFITIKYNSSGTQQWFATYNAPFNNNDEADAVICDDSSNVYVTGFITNFGTYYYTIKYNSSGVFQWGNTFGGTGNGDNKAYAITIDRSSNIYITGYISDTATGFDYATLKYNRNGTQQWARIYNGPANSDDKAYAITIDKAGSIYVTGYATDTVSSFDYATIKYDSTGSTLWTALYDGTGHSEDKAFAITVDSLNNPYVTGTSRRDTVSGTEDFATIKYNSTGGSQVWVARYTAAQNDGPSIPYSICVSKDNAYVFVTGSSWTDTTKKMDIATVKYNALTGDSVQQKRINGSGNNDDAGIMITSDTTGNIFVVGYESILNHGYDIVTLKFPLGDLISVKKISSAVPENFVLHQNYPNPFNPGTKILFDLPKSTVVKLVIYDITGREVATLANGYMRYGSYEIEFNAKNLSSGVYFYKLFSDDFTSVKKMVLLK